MFTGLVQDIGVVRGLEKTGGLRLVIETGLPEKDYGLGASVSCAGCCLTVVEYGAGWFAVEVSPETLSKTTLGAWVVGRKINLEAALRMGDALGGHMVSGHVDGVATIHAMTPDGDSYSVSFLVHDAFRRFIAPKGSVTLDGVSLTVNEFKNNVLTVNMIPHTWAHTTFQFTKAGDHVNLEVDLMARQIVQFLEARDGTF